MYRKVKVVRIFVLFAVAIFSVTASGQTILTIDRALDIATEISPDLQVAFLNKERYEQNLIAQQASLKSQFSLDLNPVHYSKNRQFDNRLSQWYTNESLQTSGTFRVTQPILWTDGALSLVNTFGWQDNKSQISGSERNSNRAFTNDLYLQLSQPIFTYNTTKVALREIQLDYENSLINYAIQRMNMEVRITNQFYAVFMAQERLTISRTELANAEENYQIIKNKVEVDLLPRSELFQAELNLANSRSTLEDRIVSLENAKEQLKQLISMPLGEDILVMAEISFDPVDLDLEEAIEHGFRTRLELRQREIDTERLDYDMIRTKALNEFKGDVNLSIGLIGDNKNLSNIYANPTQNPRVAVSFSVPIFDWGEKRARIKAQQINRQINSINAAEERKEIELDIRQTYRNIQNNLNQVNLAEQRVLNAQRTYDLNTERYRNGEITGLEMSQFEAQLSDTKVSRLETLINYKTELLYMKIISLYDFEKRVSVVPDLTELETNRRIRNKR
ncbi:MAG: TolC family protein [Rikenellaceae bacterium]|nr:TolC family protein [Rikenellaceae bacterium]